MRPVRELAAGFVDALLPGDCSGCGRPGPLLCARCAEPLSRPARLAWPRPAPDGLPVPYAVARYDGGVRAALLAYKERGLLSLAVPLAEALVRSVIAVRAAARSEGQDLALVPMPSSRARRRERGDDVVARLARQAAARLRHPRPAPGPVCRAVAALRLARPVADSAGLSAAARRANLAGALALRPGVTAALRGRAVVLVDDLITTGATLSEAADALRRCGIEPLGAAVVAATARRAGVPPQ